MMQHRLLRDHRCSAWQVCCSEQGIDPAWAVEEILAAERHVKPAVKVKKKNKALVSELSTINDILEKNEKSKLPAAMMKAHRSFVCQGARRAISFHCCLILATIPPRGAHTFAS